MWVWRAASARCGVSTHGPLSAVRALSVSAVQQSEGLTPTKAYEKRVQDGVLQGDDFQRRIAGLLDELHLQLRTYEQPSVPAPEDGIFGPKAPGAVSRMLNSLLPLPDQNASTMEQSLQDRPQGLFGLVSGWLSAPKKVEEVARPRGAPQGLYLHGDVGTGKSMLMDLFYATLPPNVTRKRRVHFHQFMIDVHQRSHFYKSKYHRASGIVGQAIGTLAAASKAAAAPAGAEASAHEGGEIDPIEPVAREIARDTEVLCFDEFQVVDIVDAMILRRLLEALLRYGVVIVITSNRPPSELYKNGIQRSSFLPCIHLLETEYLVTDLNSGTDYRKVPKATHRTYFVSTDAAEKRAYEEVWAAMTDDEPVMDERALNVWGHRLVVPQSTSSTARFSFMDLCGRPRSAADYIALCNEFNTIFIDDIPLMNLDMRDLARRFITFIDAAYESRTRLYCSSEVPIMKVFSGTRAMDQPTSDQMRALMDDLKLTMDDIGGSSIFSGDEELFAFARLLSRLTEMGTKQYADSVAQHL